MGRKLLGTALAILALIAAAWLWLHNAEDPGVTSESRPDFLAPLGPQPVATAEPAADPSPSIARDVRSPVPDSAPAVGSSAQPRARVRGRVVDARRHPAPAAVELRWDSRGTRSAPTAVDGSFAFDLFEECEDDDRATLLVARGGDGTIATRHFWLPNPSATGGFLPPSRAEDGNRIDLGTIVLMPGSQLDLLVVQAGRPVAGARVSLEGDPMVREVVGRMHTDELGHARFELLPAGLLQIFASSEDASARAIAYLPADASLTVELRPTESFEIEVVDASTLAPIAGAKLEVSETVPMPARFELDPRYGGEVWGTIPSRREPALTNDQGRARLTGIRSGGRHQFAVQAEGYLPVPGPRTAPTGERVQLVDPGRLVRIELKRSGGRRVHWPIIAGEVPPPSDGASVSLRPAPSSAFRIDDAAEPLPGRVEGTQLVVDGVEGRGMFLAEAGDGLLAMALAPPTGDAGKEISFRRPRRIDVIVRDFAGLPVAEAAVSARSQGNSPLTASVRTDIEGAAVLAGLYGGMAGVYVAAPGESGLGHMVGNVDLEQGDGRVETALPGNFFARVVLRIDGVPALPSRFIATPEAVEEWPERGELRLRMTATATGKPSRISIRAQGFASVSGMVEPGTDGSEPSLEFDLVRTGELQIDVRRQQGQRVALYAERFDDKAQKWGRTADNPLGELSMPNGPGGGFRIAGLSPGRWRAVDKPSGCTSSEAQLTATDLFARVRLDVAEEQWISGHVEVPTGEVATSVVILIDGIDAADPMPWNSPGSVPPSGAPVSEAGTFKLRIPGDREVTVRPWHAWLVPTEGSVVTTRVGRSAVAMKLVPGRELRIPSAMAMQEGSTSIRIAAFTGELGSSPPKWIHAPIFGGVARTSGLAPGRYSLWIDAHASFAPITLRDVEVGEGLTSLDPLELTRGSSLRVRVIVPEGQTPPRIGMAAFSLSEPQYSRQLNSRGEVEVVLRGLGAGRYRVTTTAIMDREHRDVREIEVDGVHDLAFDFTP